MPKDPKGQKLPALMPVPTLLAVAATSVTSAVFMVLTLLHHATMPLVATTAGMAVTFGLIASIELWRRYAQGT